MKSMILVLFYVAIFGSASDTHPIDPTRSLASNSTLEKRGMFLEFLTFCISGQLETDSIPATATVVPTPATSGLNGSNSKKAASNSQRKLTAVMDNMLELRNDLKNREGFQRLSPERKLRELARAVRIWNKCLRKYQSIGEVGWENLAQHTKRKDAAKLVQFQDDLICVFKDTRGFIRHYQRECGLEVENSAVCSASSSEEQ